ASPVRHAVQLAVGPEHEAPDRRLAVEARGLAEVVQLLELSVLADPVDDAAVRIRRASRARDAVEKTVRGFNETAGRRSAVRERRRPGFPGKGMQQRELPVGGQPEDGAVTAVDAPGAVVAAARRRAVEVSIRRLDQL